MTNILLMLIAFLGMEFMAWFTHKYIMHGLLWRLHRDHHHRDNKGFFEQNDYFFFLALRYYTLVLRTIWITDFGLEWE